MAFWVKETPAWLYSVVHKVASRAQSIPGLLLDRKDEFTSSTRLLLLHATAWQAPRGVIPWEGRGRSIYGAAGKAHSTTLGIQRLQGSLREMPSVSHWSQCDKTIPWTLSGAQLCSLPRDREGRGLTDTLLSSQLGWIWASLLEVLPATETFYPQAHLLFLQIATPQGFLCFASQAKGLVMVLGLTKWCRTKFLPKSTNQISLTSQSSAKRGS